MLQSGAPGWDIATFSPGNEVFQTLEEKTYSLPAVLPALNALWWGNAPGTHQPVADISYAIFKMRWNECSCLSKTQNCQ